MLALELNPENHSLGSLYPTEVSPVFGSHVNADCMNLIFHLLIIKWFLIKKIQLIDIK